MLVPVSVSRGCWLSSGESEVAKEGARLSGSDEYGRLTDQNREGTKAPFGVRKADPVSGEARALGVHFDRLPLHQTWRALTLPRKASSLSCEVGYGFSVRE